MTTPVVECIGATKRFDGVSAVDRVNFALEPGEILSILGPSGGGKTTLLRLIAGFETLDEGEIRIRGRLVATPDMDVPPERRAVGMVFQEYTLFPHLTVAQNILFGLSGRAKEERRERLLEVLDLVKLNGLESRRPHELSGGEQQRVALARSLAPSPVTVLLDEPFSNIDATSRTDMRREVEGILRENRITTVFVTHDREEAFSMADRIGVMREGRLEQIDSPDALHSSPATPFVARVSSLCDFMRGEIRGDRVETELGRFIWTSEDDVSDGDAVDLVVHADDFEALPDPEGRGVVAYRDFRGDETILTVRLPSGAALPCRVHQYSTLRPGSTVMLVPASAAPFVAFKAGGSGPG